MACIHKPLKKIRGVAKGVAYTGFGSHWKCQFGSVIVIAGDLEALEIVSRKMEELKAHHEFDADLCPEVAVFQLTDVGA